MKIPLLQTLSSARCRWSSSLSLPRRPKGVRLLLLLALTGSLALSSCSRSYRVGDLYHQQGIVVSVDADGQPTMLLALEEQCNLDADSALRWAATLDEGWSLPTREQWELIRKQRILLNRTLDDKQLPSVARGHTFYWSSTACSPSHVYACGPDGVRCYFRSNHSDLYRVRAVFVFNEGQE